MRTSRYTIPSSVAGGLFAAILFSLIRHGLKVNRGVFVYPLDDAYIHLAVSRNLALHGVWGISPNAFSGASSSPAWTLLLAAAASAIGVHVQTPLVLNIIVALVLITTCSIVLGRTLPKASILYLTLALSAVVVIAPLPGIALIGMEHLLHALFILMLVSGASLVVSSSGASPNRKSAVSLLLVSALVSGSLRYESCFAVAVVVVVLLLRRQGLLALLTAFLAALGPITYAMYSHAHSGEFLPFSVIMKSSIPTGHHGINALAQSELAPILMLLIIAFCLTMAQRGLEAAGQRANFWSFTNTFLVITLATTFLHAEVGPSGWLMRYEAYLYVLGSVAIGLALPEIFGLLHGRVRGRWWIAAASIVALLPVTADLLRRVHRGYSDFAASLHDRYVEHLPQALFVQSEMPNATVLANDIGFLAFYAPKVVILDPLGLGSIEPVRLVRKHQAIDPEFVAKWAADDRADLAILHTDFPGMESIIPTRWILVESWCFPHNLIFKNHVESFYAPDAPQAEILRAKLARFSDVSPEVVRYRFDSPNALPPNPPRGETASCPVAPDTY